jgi:spermidine/putrescine transport system permease protein
MNASRNAILIAVGVFLYLPIAILAVFSFNASPLMAFPLSGFTWDWYRHLADNREFQAGFVTSFLIAQPVGVMSAGLGLMAALALTSSRLRWRLGFIALLLVPFLAPRTVLSIAQAMMISRLGLDRGPVVLIIAQTIVIIPFTAALLSSVLMRLDARLEEAARDLGATPWESFRLVVLPQIQSTLVAAYSIGVILSLGDLTIATFLSGRVQPLSLIVASQFLRQLSPDLNAIQVVMLALTAVIVAITEIYGWRRRRRRERLLEIA